MKKQLYENYPFWRILIYNFFVWSVYLVGLYLTFLLWAWASLIFFIFLVFVESSVYRNACSCCYYYGKMCVSGRSKIAPLIVKRKNPKKFCEKKFSLKDFIPNLLIAFIPIVAGIYLLIKNFNWFILSLTLWPLIITFAGNPILYGKVACPHCKQGAKCCPACEFFLKQKKKK